LEIYVNIFAPPLASSRTRKKLMAKEFFFNLTLKFMNSDVNSTSSAVQDHHHLGLS